uniref:Uncharacterized protein n=1 Tax=Glossina pallidipes TaxID=7398 RepID=A0A1B0ACJ6_GLOPL
MQIRGAKGNSTILIMSEMRIPKPRAFITDSHNTLIQSALYIMVTLEFDFMESYGEVYNELGSLKALGYLEYSLYEENFITNNKTSIMMYLTINAHSTMPAFVCGTIELCPLPMHF